MQENERRVSFCPTMKPFIQDLNFNKGTAFLDAGSAANALYYLTAGEVDAVLIGRTAKKRELHDQVKEKRLGEGYTLVFNRKMGIEFQQLPGFTIHTYLPRSIAENILPDNKIIFHKSLEECLVDNLSEPVLIDWNDYQDEFELLIPLDNRGKVPVFRAPVLYYTCPIEDILQE